MTQNNERISVRKETWVPEKEFIPLMFGKDLSEFEKLSKEEKSKIELFEKGLESTLTKDDTLEDAIRKIVKVALTAEFGPGLVKAKSSEGMISTISRAIMADSTLRKQALIIVDRFAKPLSSGSKTKIRS